MWGPHIIVAMRAYFVNVCLSAPVVSQITILSSPLEMIHLFGTPLYETMTELYIAETPCLMHMSCSD